jgi:invasion protein IalB
VLTAQLRDWKLRDAASRECRNSALSAAHAPEAARNNFQGLAGNGLKRKGTGNEMGQSKPKFSLRGSRAVVWGTVVGLGLTGLAALATAQQAPPPAKKDKAPAAKPAAKDAKPADPKAAAAAKSQPWVKLCDKVGGVAKGKDGKEEKKELNLCITMHERLDQTGNTIVSAALRQIEGQDKQVFMIMVPPLVFLQPGLRATFFPKDLWEQALKNEKVDEAKLKMVQIAFTACHPGGCNAEMEATQDVINNLKTSGGLIVTFAHISGQGVSLPVPLEGFNLASAGPPIDAKSYNDARRKLVVQLVQRQQQLMEEHKKQQEEQQKATGSVTPAPAAKAAAPAQKK